MKHVWRWLLVSVGSLVVLAGAVWALSSSPPKALLPDLGAFDKYQGSILFAVDLRNDEAGPLTGLVLNIQPASATRWNTLAIPFHLDYVEPNRELLLCAGLYDSFVTINYLPTPTGGGSRGIRFAAPSSHFPSRHLDTRILGPGIYFQRDGLERHFVLRLQDVGNRIPVEIQNLSPEFPEAVAVALPTGAEGRPVRNNMTTDPQVTKEDGAVRYFEPTNPKSPVRHVELRYALNPTESQKLIAEALGKAFAALAVPLISLIFMKREDIANPGWRRTGLWVIVILELAVMSGLIWLMGPMSLQSRFDTVLNALVLLAGLGATVFCLVAQLKAGGPAQHAATRAP